MCTYVRHNKDVLVVGKNMALKRSEEGVKNEGGKGRRIVVEAAVKPKKKTGLYASRPVFFFPSPLNPFL